MDATALHTIRAWVGSQPSNADLEVRLARAGNAEQVALEVLRERRADFVASYAEFQVDGDAKWSAAKNIEALDRQIAQLETLCGAGSSKLTTGQLASGRGAR